MPALSETDPQHIAIVAALAGATVPDVRNARVVDVACGGAEGLVASALALPDATFVGIGESEERVALARTLAREVGAANASFVAGGLGALDRIAACDVVVADGVWSSLDDDRRASFVAWLGRALSPNGLVYASFDAMPGARLLDVVRAVLAHVTPDREVRRELAAGVLARFVSSTHDGASDGYAAMVRAKSTQLASLLSATPASDALLDEIAGGATRASYFRDVTERLATAGLAFVAEARTGDILDDPLDPAAAALADALANGDAREEYADFLRGRTFRRSIFARRRAPATFAELHVAARVRAGERVRTLSGDDAPLEGDALALAFELARVAPESRAVAPERVIAADPSARRAMLAAMQSGALRCFVSPPHVVARVSSLPRAQPMARAFARRSGPVSNAYGEHVALDAVSTDLLALTDGTRDRDALADELARIAVARGVFAADGVDRARVAAGVDAMLRGFAEAGLLER